MRRLDGPLGLYADFFILNNGKKSGNFSYKKKNKNKPRVALRDRERGRTRLSGTKFHTNRRKQCDNCFIDVGNILYHTVYMYLHVYIQCKWMKLTCKYTLPLPRYAGKKLKTAFTLWRRIECFPSKLRRRILKAQQVTGVCDCVVRKWNVIRAVAFGERHSPERLILSKLSFLHLISNSIPYCNSSHTDSYFVRHRFVYKFVCDLKNLLGYSAGELSRLVLEAEETSTDAEPGTNGGH